MSGNYENGFKIYFEDDDNNNDIFSSSEPQSTDFEDIASSSNAANDLIFSSFSNGESGKYSRKKRGIAKVFETASEWWTMRSGAQKTLLVIASIVLLAVLVFAIWKLPFIEMRGKLFCSAFALMVFNVFAYFCVYWKKRRAQTVLMGAVSVLLCGIMILTLFFWLPFLSLVYNFDHSFSGDAEDLGAVPSINKDITNIALFGVDTRTADSFTGNSDSIMILSLNKKTHKVKIISIMRDSLVPIEVKGKTTYGKLNSAYGGGGAERAVKTLNTIFDLDITEYATVNFFGMAKIIDAVGGIEAELTRNEVTARGDNNHGINDMIDEVCRILGYNPKDYYVTKSGKQQLNGIQAVAYSRIRYVANIWGTSNDYGRTDRQRYVMEQLFNKALTMKKSSYPSLIKALIPYTVTSLAPDEILSLALTVLGGEPEFQQARMPQNEYLMTSPKGSFGSVVYYDLDFATELIHAFIYDDITFEEYTETNGITKNNWYGKKGNSYSSGSLSTGSTSSEQTSSNNSSTGSEEQGGGNTTTSSSNVSSGTDSEDGSSSEDSGSSSSSSEESSSNESSSKEVTSENENQGEEPENENDAA